MNKLALSFLEKASVIHNNFYNYDDMIYINCKVKIKIICPIHGAWYQIPDAHLRGSGCPDCGRLRIAKKNTHETTQGFIEKSNIKHNNKYIYDALIYISCNSKVKILCPINNHGLFEQLPYWHLKGTDCPKCGALKAGKNNSTNIAAKFIKRAIFIHKNKYDYSLINYQGALNKVKIICPIHSIFEQDPHHHLSGMGCPKCSINISYLEIKWLDTLNISNNYRQKSIIINNKTYKVDAFDPITNTIYEFYGDFWHGNPLIYNPTDLNMVNKKFFGNLYQKTIERENILINNGYKIISIWENDFNKEYDNES